LFVSELINYRSNLLKCMSVCDRQLATDPITAAIKVASYKEWAAPCLMPVN